MKQMANSSIFHFLIKIWSSTSRRSYMLFNIYISFTIATILVSIPSQRINGSLVPTILLQDSDSSYSKCLSVGMFQAFVLCVMLTFASAVATLLIQNKPKLAVSSELCSMSFLAMAMSLMMWAVLTRTLKGFDIFSIVWLGKWGWQQPLVKTYDDYERKNISARE